MNLSQKRTCFGCKALENGNCKLGYSIGLFASSLNDFMPCEPCPKPMNDANMEIADRELHKGRIHGRWFER